MKDLAIFAAQLDKNLPLLDLHGKRIHQALEELDYFLSKMIEKNQTSSRIVYGIGTGALREAVVEKLRNNHEIATLYEEVGSCIILIK